VKLGTDTTQVFYLCGSKTAVALKICNKLRRDYVQAATVTVKAAALRYVSLNCEW